MKVILFAIMLVFSLKCPAQLANSKNDTLLKKLDARLPLDNGGVFVFNRFVVRGDIYVTEKVFVFHPKPYKKGRYGMYNDLVKDILIPYDSILVAKSGLGGLMIKTSSKKYIISVGGGKEVVTKINQLRKEAKAK